MAHKSMTPVGMIAAAVPLMGVDAVALMAPLMVLAVMPPLMVVPLMVDALMVGVEAE